MSSWLVLAPLAAAGIGMAAAYGVTHKDWETHLHFVQRSNLEEELEDLEIELEALEVCVECGDTISPEEIGTVFLDEGEYKVVCDKRECLDTYDMT